VASLAPNSGLLGGTPEDAALVDQWIHLADSEVGHYTQFIQGICTGRVPYNKQVRLLFPNEIISPWSFFQLHVGLTERQTRSPQDS